MATGSLAVLPRYRSSMRSASLSPFCCAVRALIHAAGSQVIFVNGFGSSCSQPLLAKRPSQTVGSGRKIISRPPLAGGDWRGAIGEDGGGVAPSVADVAALATPAATAAGAAPGPSPIA